MYPFHTGVLNKQFTVGTAVNIQFYDICTLIDRGAKGLQLQGMLPPQTPLWAIHNYFLLLPLTDSSYKTSLCLICFLYISIFFGCLIQIV